MSPHSRATAFGHELIKIHDWLRESLDELLQRMGTTSTPGTSPPLHTEQLQAYCLGLCSALSAHHVGEDSVAFPALAAQVPELAPVLLELQHDHAVTATILRRINSAATSLSPTSTPAEVTQVREELEGLAAVMESHFSWEERRVVRALDEMGVREEIGTREEMGPFDGISAPEDARVREAKTGAARTKELFGVQAPIELHRR